MDLLQELPTEASAPSLVAEVERKPSTVWEDGEPQCGLKGWNVERPNQEVFEIWLLDVCLDWFFSSREPYGSISLSQFFFGLKNSVLGGTSPSFFGEEQMGCQTESGPNMQGVLVRPMVFRALPRWQGWIFPVAMISPTKTPVKNMMCAIGDRLYRYCCITGWIVSRQI